MITFHLENWFCYRQDPSVETLWAEHYAELAGDKQRMPLGIDEGFYEFLASRGMLSVVCARKAGVLVGYCLVLCKPHPRYRSVLCGFEDCYFLTAAERGEGAGKGLIEAALAALIARGCKRAYFMTKLSHDHGKLFEALGFTACDRVYTKWLGAEAPLEE